MKKLLGIMVLGLFLITPSQADDIRDFQIEGMSIGDSLLNYYSEKDIKNNSPSYIYYDRITGKVNNDYIFFEKSDTGSFAIYDGIQIAIKSEDKKYKIMALAGAINIKKGCLSKKKEIEEEIINSININNKWDKEPFAHPDDKSGKSLVYTSYLDTEGSHKGNIKIACFNWTKESGFIPHLRIGILTEEYFNWLETVR